MPRDISIPRKFCRKCSTTKLIADFFRASDKKSGHASNCKICCTKRNKESLKRNGSNWISRKPEYKSWQHLKSRVLNTRDPDYPNYGGRGITVCERWLGKGGFLNFLTDMGKRPDPKRRTVERINNNGNYEPGNCEWITNEAQARNRRSNVVVTYNNRSQILVDWVNELGLDYSRVQQRLLAGWPVERAFFTASTKNNPIHIPNS